MGKSLHEFSSLKKLSTLLTENIYRIQPHLRNEKINLVHLSLFCIYFSHDMY